MFLSLCMILVVNALLVGRSQTPTLLLAFTCNEYELYSCIQLPKTKHAFVSTIPTYMWYLIATPK